MNWMPIMTDAETLQQEQRRTIDDAIRTGQTPRWYWREQRLKLRAIEKAQAPAVVLDGRGE